MEIGRLRLTELGDVTRGEVMVTTGYLWWKRTEWRAAFRMKGSDHWRWADTGEFTPNAVINREVAARHGTSNQLSRPTNGRYKQE